MLKKIVRSIKMGMEIGAAQGIAGLPQVVRNKKGNFNMLSDIAKSLVVFGILIGVGVLILTKFLDSINSSSAAYQQLGSVIGLFSSLTTWAGIVLIVLVGYIILRYLGVFDRV